MASTHTVRARGVATLPLLLLSHTMSAEVRGHLKNRQHNAVEHMLKLKSAIGDQWKVLVFDAAGRDVISPLLNVAQLRRNGVTLHMLVRGAQRPAPHREPIRYDLPVGNRC